MVITPAEVLPRQPVRCQRSDARENRDRILAAAAQAFADEGLGVSLIEIARRAGVGNATLHRNFTKEQLIDELFQDWYGRRQAVAECALADPDPWHGLVSSPKTRWPTAPATAPSARSWPFARAGGSDSAT